MKSADGVGLGMSDMSINVIKCHHYEQSNAIKRNQTQSKVSTRQLLSATEFGTLLAHL